MKLPFDDMDANLDYAKLLMEWGKSLYFLAIPTVFGIYGIGPDRKDFSEATLSLVALAVLLFVAGSFQYLRGMAMFSKAIRLKEKRRPRSALARRLRARRDDAQA